MTDSTVNIYQQIMTHGNKRHVLCIVDLYTTTKSHRDETNILTHFNPGHNKIVSWIIHYLLNKHITLLKPYRPIVGDNVTALITNCISTAHVTAAAYTVINTVCSKLTTMEEIHPVACEAVAKKQHLDKMTYVEAWYEHNYEYQLYSRLFDNLSIG